MTLTSSQIHALAFAVTVASSLYFWRKSFASPNFTALVMTLGTGLFFFYFGFVRDPEPSKSNE